VIKAIKVVHTLAWFSIEACMGYVLYAGFARRSDRSAGVAAAVVAGESLIFAGNGFRCPLTKVAERLGAERGSVTDIYLPRWLAHNLPAIHVPLMGLAGYLYARNLQASTDLAAEAGAAAVGYLPLTAAPRRAAAEQRSAANGH
jgi:hypothetical protein